MVFKIKIIDLILQFKNIRGYMYMLNIWTHVFRSYFEKLKVFA